MDTPKQYGIFGGLFCIQHNHDIVEFCIERYKEMDVFCFVDNCIEKAKGTFISLFQFNKFCPSHRREDARPAQRMRYSMDQLKARVKEYMKSMADLLNTNKKIYLVTVSRQGNVEHLTR
jgi:hypothetical protein